MGHYLLGYPDYKYRSIFSIKLYILPLICLKTSLVLKIIGVSPTLVHLDVGEISYNFTPHPKFYNLYQGGISFEIIKIKIDVIGIEVIL